MFVSTKAVRIIAKPLPENPAEAPIFLDVVIDDDDMIATNRAVFGLSGNFDHSEEHFYPFVLQKDGKMNFGRGYEDTGDQYAKLDIRDVPIRVGQLITRRSDWAPQLGYLRIDQLIPLAP